ncbi:MAG: hypothetical protein ACOCWG_01480, partial [bacterium]
MGKKSPRTEFFIDGVKYKQIYHQNKNDAFWMNVPLVPDNVMASGLHLIDKKRNQSHYDFYLGKDKTNKKEYLDKPPRIRNLKIDIKQNTIFVGSPNNPILVLRGKNEEEEWISLNYYNKNKYKYYVKLGSDVHPNVVGLKMNKYSLSKKQLKTIRRQIERDDQYNVQRYLLPQFLPRIIDWIKKSDNNTDVFDKYLALFIATNMTYNLWAKIKNPERKEIFSK